MVAPSSSGIKPIDKASIHRITSGQVVIDLQTAVKELVENSVDAGATNIEVRFKHYGLNSVEVIDNGCGIAEEDYESIALKHHTSKLEVFEDLSTVQTFGFRGEALSSLCALCEQVTVTTATDETAPKGTRVELSFSGEVKSRQVEARKRGTTVLVSKLFLPLPVRRKEFERNMKREFAKALSLLQAYALGPCSVKDGIRLTVTNQTDKGQKSTQLQTQGTPSLKATVTSLWGPKAGDNLIDLDISFSVDTEKSVLKRLKAFNQPISDSIRVHVRGLTSKFAVGCGRLNADRQFFYINGRPCNLNKVQKAFNDVYRTFSANQLPFLVADFIIPTESCDVNVSPDKRTVFINNEDKLITGLKEALESHFSPSRSTYNLGKSQDHLTQGSLSQAPNPSLPRFSAPSASQSDGSRSRSSSLVDQEPPTPVAPARQDGGDNTPSASTRLLDLPAQSQSVQLSGVVQHDRSDSPMEIDRDVAAQTVHSKKPSGASSPSGSGDITVDTRRTSWRDTLIKRASTQSRKSPIAEELDEEGQPRKRRRLQMDTRPPSPRIEVEDSYSSPLDLPSTEPSKDILLTSVNGSTRKQPRKEIGLSSWRQLSAFAAPRSHLPKEDAAEPIDRTADDTIDRDSVVSNIDEEQPSSPRRPSTYLKTLPLIAETTEDKDHNTNEDESGDEDEDSYVLDSVKKSLSGAVPESPIPASSRPEIVRRSDSSKDISFKFDIDKTSAIWRKLAEIQKAPPSSDGNSGPRDENHVKISSDAGVSNSDNDSKASNALARVIEKDDFTSMFVIGQFNLGFIIVRRRKSGAREGKVSMDDLFIVDQHAADEKYNFETLQLTTKIQAQKLLRPRMLELTAADELLATENLEVLRSNGFEVEAIEDTTSSLGGRIRLIAQPVSKSTVFDMKDLEELIHLMRDAPSGSMVRCSKARAMFAMRACRKSVMVGMPLNHSQMLTVVRHMGTMDQPWNCPHGRPTMRHLADITSSATTPSKNRLIHWNTFS